MSQTSLVAFLSLSLVLSFFLYHLRHEELGTARRVKAKLALLRLYARMCAFGRRPLPSGCVSMDVQNNFKQLRPLTVSRAARPHVRK